MNDGEDIRLLRDIATSLRQMSDTLELTFSDAIRLKLETVLAEPRKVIAYQNSSDENSSRQVASLVGVSDRTIRDWWKEWADLGIVRETETAGRFERKFDLRRFGVSIPRGG